MNDDVLRWFIGYPTFDSWYAINHDEDGEEWNIKVPLDMVGPFDTEDEAWSYHNKKAHLSPYTRRNPHVFYVIGDRVRGSLHP